jgi:two-component system response regulator NreC
VGRKLEISPRTAEAHRASLMRKVGLRSQSELVRFAIRNKIISA